MIDCSDVHDGLPAWGSGDPDPRIDGNNLRCIQGDGDRGSVLLVGVVHDHPASTYRAAHVLETVSAETLALELPPLAMPLFRLYADDEYTPPRMGGEMSTALQAFERDRTVGIDAPNWIYFQRLLAQLRDEGLSVDLVRDLVPRVAAGVIQAVACRFGAVLGSTTPLRLRVYQTFEHGASSLDTPAEQAADEASQMSREQAFLGAIQLPRGMQLIESVREASMADRLRELRRDGDVIAIVGMEHLDALHSGLGGM